MKNSVPNYRVYGDLDTDFTLQPVHIDDINRSTKQNNWLIAPHRHDDLCHLVYFLSGSGSMHIQGHDYEIVSPCLGIIPAGDVHSFNVHDNIEGTIITVSKLYLETVLAGSKSCLALVDSPYFISNKTQGIFFKDLGLLFEKIRTIYTERQPARSLSIQCLLGLIFSQISGLASESYVNKKLMLAEDKNLWYYRQFQNSMSYSFAEKKPVSEYAAELRISSTHLNRICQAVAEKSALKVIHDRIVSEAKVNLAYTFQSVSEVAYRLGFVDVSYFSRFFKKQTGIAPNSYQAKIRRQHPTEEGTGNRPARLERV
jgi:AraC family transcriptional activator of pobA